MNYLYFQNEKINGPHATLPSKTNNSNQQTPKRNLHQISQIVIQKNLSTLNNHKDNSNQKNEPTNELIEQYPKLEPQIIAKEDSVVKKNDITEKQKIKEGNKNQNDLNHLNMAKIFDDYNDDLIEYNNIEYDDPLFVLYEVNRQNYNQSADTNLSTVNESQGQKNDNSPMFDEF